MIPHWPPGLVTGVVEPPSHILESHFMNKFSLLLHWLLVKTMVFSGSPLHVDDLKVFTTILSPFLWQAYVKYLVLSKLNDLIRLCFIVLCWQVPGLLKFILVTIVICRFFLIACLHLWNNSIGRPDPLGLVDVGLVLVEVGLVLVEVGWDFVFLDGCSGCSGLSGLLLSHVQVP